MSYMDLARQYDELMEDILKKLTTFRTSEKRAPWSQDELIRSFHMPTLGRNKENEEKDVEIGGVPSEKDESPSI